MLERRHPVSIAFALLVAPACLAPLDDDAADSGGIMTAGSASAADAASDPDGGPAAAGSNPDPDSNSDAEAGSDGASASDDDGSSSGSPENPPTAPDGYYVDGNTVYDADDQPHRFLGVARPSLEWSSSGESLSGQDYQHMADWGANTVRIALNQGFWLDGSSVHDAAYPSIIDQQIGWAHDAGLDVILDLHWSDRGDFATTPDQQRMADANSIAFWTALADRYQSDGHILFELYNEPHDISWAVWRNGGDSGEGWNAVGMQQLYDAVRATGAENLVIAGGLDFAYDLTGLPGDGEIDGYNIMYASHPYDYDNKQPSAWPTDWGFVADSHPVIVTEFGSFDCDASYTSALLDYADQHQLSWTAWAWFPGGCDFPSLIEDWNATPTATGTLVRDALMSN
jgi:endoglucanase